MKKLFLSLFLLTTLSACSWQTPVDPFELQPEELRVTLEGEIFPFDVSVSTKATHRLENNGRLSALLMSDIVNLELFERKKVQVTGVKRTEKMREILVVEKVEFQVTEEIAITEKTEERFLANDFTFVYPFSWQYSTSPDGIAYFSEKESSLRRVFLKFSVKPLTREDREADLSVQIAGLTGIKNITTDELDREVQKITLFSNITERKYEFEFTAAFEEFDKKKYFFALLNSFTEGEVAVVAAREDDLKQEAKKLEQQLQQEERQADMEAMLELAMQEVDPSEKSDSSVNLDSFIEKVQSIVPKSSKDTLKEVSEEFLEDSLTVGVEADLPVEINPIITKTMTLDQPEFINLINANAFDYTSASFDFSMQVPFGFWFRNFGKEGESLMTMGLADQDFSVLAAADFVFEIMPGSVLELTETSSEETVIFTFPRTEKSHFVFRGPSAYRNAMLSIWSTIP